MLEHLVRIGRKLCDRKRSRCCQNFGRLFDMRSKNGDKSPKLNVSKKVNWDVIEGDFLKFLEEFHRDASIVKELNKSFIALILNLDHSFLDHMLSEMSFLKKWRLWVRSCISSPVISILVNGSPTRQFGLKKGLRQRDPLSPFLFNVAVEDLSAVFRKAIDMDMLGGIVFGEATVQVTHLQFADDTIMFIQPNVDYLRNVKRILKCFELASGLHLNF
ncbi:hypothetical protein Dsin_013370 [Dipteronia sinensis]|uniref:Reverse transcriptase domain-containing protein n=1 Tax=Dipteronia sinensis TaxID=43782 RepID=A0AAE0EAI1_9ROSI|nr:hypothetical protein Dsin_013370 [Dipteronia sinensis]